MVSALSLDETYHTVLGRLARYKDMNPELALSIVTDAHFMTTMAEEADEGKIEEKIESKLVNLVDQLQREKEVLVTGSEEKDERIERLEERIRTIQAVVEDERMENELENEKKRREVAEKEVERLKEELKVFRESLVRWIFFLIGLALTSTLLWFRQSWLGLDWPWLDTHKNNVPLVLSTQLLLVLVFLNIPLKQHWKVWIGSIFAVILTILGLMA
jgi:hypothetical protein